MWFTTSRYLLREKSVVSLTAEDTQSITIVSGEQSLSLTLSREKDEEKSTESTDYYPVSYTHLSYALGYYQVSGYGECTLFVHTQNPPYLLIQLPNRTILFNGGTPEQTREYQNSLAAAISP